MFCTVFLIIFVVVLALDVDKLKQLSNLCLVPEKAEGRNIG